MSRNVFLLAACDRYGFSFGEQDEQLEFICCLPACTHNYTCCLIFYFGPFSQHLQLSDQLWASVKTLALAAAALARQANTFLAPTFWLSGMDLFQPSDIYDSLFFLDVLEV